MAGRRRTDSLRPRRRSPARYAGALLLAGTLLAGAWHFSQAAAPVPPVWLSPSAAPAETAEPSAAIAPSVSAAPGPTGEAPIAEAYVLNTSSRRFHRPECSSVRDMKPDNRRDFTGSRDEVIGMGYAPCGRCKP